MKRLILALIFSLFLGPLAFSQASVALSPVAHQQFLDINGKPLTAGRLFTYVAGTTTPQSTYVDATGTAVNTNPIILDAGGFANIWLVIGEQYKFVLYNSGNVLQWSVDNFSTASGGGGGGSCPGAVPDTSVIFAHPLGTCDGVTKFKTNESGQVDVNAGGTVQIESVTDPTNNFTFGQGHQWYIHSNSADYDGSTADGFTAYIDDSATPPTASGAIIGTNVTVSGGLLTVAASNASTLFNNPGLYAQFSGCVSATFLNSQVVQVTNADGSQLVAAGTSFSDYGSAADNCTVKLQSSSNPIPFYSGLGCSLGGDCTGFYSDTQHFGENPHAFMTTDFLAAAYGDGPDYGYGFRSKEHEFVGTESAQFLAESSGGTATAHTYAMKVGEPNFTPYFWTYPDGTVYSREAMSLVASSSAGSCTADVGLSDCTATIPVTGDGPPASETLILTVCATGSVYDTLDWTADGTEPTCKSQHMITTQFSGTNVADGVQVTFGAATGHTLGANFTIPVTVSYGSQLDIKGGTYLTSTALPQPSSPNLTPAPSGATTWTYCVVEKWNGIPTQCSATSTTSSGPATLDVSNVISVALNNLTYRPGTVCDLYRTGSGGTPSTTGLIASNKVCNSTVVDNGLAGDSSTAPSVNLTGHTVLADGYIVTPSGTPLTLPGISGTGCVGVTSGVVGTTASACSGTSVTFKHNGSNNSSQSILDAINSTVNAVGLTATASNPSGGQIKIEITGGSYTGNAATATSATSATTATTAGALSGTPTLCTGTDFATGILANGNATGCATPGAGGSAPALKTNTVNITTQTALDLTNSTANVSGLAVAFTNPSGSVVKAEVSGTVNATQVNGLAVPASATIVGTNSSRQIVDASSATLTNNTSGNAATATALAANPTDCSSNLFANAIAASGNLTCAAAVTANAGTTHQWLRSLTAAGVFSGSQPASNDLSDYGSIPNAALLNPAVTANGQTCTLGSTCTIPFQTNTSSNSSQAGINLKTSTVNAVGLIVTPTNTSGIIDTFEITGNSYSGTAAKATALASTPTQCSGQYASGIAASGNANCIGVANTTATYAGATVTANTCVAQTPITMSGLKTSATIYFGNSTDPSGINGWGSIGGMVWAAWPTANTVNWKVCNQTSSSIPAGAITWNVSAMQQ